MANYITIDGGTTNTRIGIVADHTVVDMQRLSVGARNGTDDRSVLKSAIKAGIDGILKRNGMRELDITCILASGMITSEYGLCELDHISAPAGPCELHGTMYTTVIEEISSIPFAFVRGVKSVDGTLEHTDMMRGEETELVGLFDGEGVYILSGSHSKIVSVGADGRINSFKTMLTGEMISALCHHTILNGTVDVDGQPIDADSLLRGYDYACRHGLNEALFKVRVLKNLFGSSPSQLYNFYMGAVLCDEIQHILSLASERVVVSGQQQIKESVATLLQRLMAATVTIVPSEVSDVATAIGLVRIYELS